MKASKRILSLVLAIAMIATCGFTTVFAEVLPEAENGGLRSSGDGGSTDSTYTVTVNAGSNGSASASPSSAAKGTEITITAEPVEGYEVDQVTSSDVTLSGSGNTRTFTMPEQNVTVAVSFKAKAAVSTKHKITSAPTSCGRFTVTVDDVTATEAEAGKTVKINTDPDVGFEIDTISVKDADNGDVALTGSGASRTFTMPAKAVTVTVTFKATEYAITKAATTNGSFTVKVNGSDATKAAKNATVTVNATENSGYEVDTISAKDADNGNVAITGTGTSRTFTMPGKAVTVTVTFKEVTLAAGEYLINKNPATNGSFLVKLGDNEVSKAQKDDVLTVETTPDANYALEKISVTGADAKPIGVTDSGSFTMPEQAVTVAVTFKSTLVEHAITSEPSANGSYTVKVDGAVATKAVKGKTVAIATTPKEGFVLNTVVVTGADGKPVTVTGAGSERTFTMPDQAVKVAVTFKAAPAEALFKIALYNVENATYTIKADGKDISAIGRTAKAGAKITATFAAKDGYTLTKVESDAPGWTGKDGSYSFTMPAKDVGISVFTEKKPVIEIDPDVDGDVPANTTIGGTAVDHVSAAEADEEEVAAIEEKAEEELEKADGLKKDKKAPSFGAIDIFPVDKDGNPLAGILSKPITVKITVTTSGFVLTKNNMRILHKHGNDVEVIKLSGVRSLGNNKYELSFPMSKFSVVMPVVVETTSTPGGGTSSGSTSSSGGSSGGGGSSISRGFDGERLYLVGGEIVPASVVEEMAGNDKVYTVVYRGKTYTFNGKNIAKPAKNIMYYTPEEFMKLVNGKVISTVTNDTSNPDTGANDFMSLALALAVVSLAGVATCSISKKK